MISQFCGLTRLSWAACWSHRPLIQLQSDGIWAAITWGLYELEHPRWLTHMPSALVGGWGSAGMLGWLGLQLCVVWGLPFTWPLHQSLEKGVAMDFQPHWSLNQGIKVDF